VDVILIPEADAEFQALPEAERFAMAVPIAKLRTYGDQLPYPHSSRVQGAASLRELRPRAGRSPWRAFYRRIGAAMVIGAIGSEAQHDPRGFRRAVADAERRLDAWERERS
jgi:hypothetical protein